MTQRPPTEPLCDQPPLEVFYLDLRCPSSQKGGTKIADDVMDWETHLKRLQTPEGYRPAQCDHCGGTRLHGHGLRLRALAGDELRVIEIRRYRCARCRAVWQVLPGFVARRLWRRWEVVEGALTGKRRRGRAPVPERTQRRWRSSLRRGARVVRHVLSATQRPEIDAVVRRVAVTGTRGDVLAAHREHANEGALPELAALLHRLAPGLRMM